MDWSSGLKIVSGLLGGLAVFIYGMNMMSEGLQKAAGEKMKAILGFLTKNPVLGVLAGALVTSVLQSSSATTVMVIGFVSAGLMTLPQAISIVFGANIGTTMTAQLLAFKISDFIWPIIFIGFLIYFIPKNKKIKYIGQSIFAFGLLFVGIETMGSVMKPLASSSIFTALISQVSHIPVLGVLLGVVMTMIVQSSSATIAVLQNFASQPGADGIHSSIGLIGAIPILLGDNIGTTITALLACIGQSRDAKRTAVAHSVFNITGCIIFICIIPWFAGFVEWISPNGNELDIISRQIANAHTTFNIVNTLIWLPFIWLLVKIVTLIVPGKTGAKQAVVSQPHFLDEKIFHQPVFAMHLASKEIYRCINMVSLMLDNAKTAILSKNESALEEVRKNGKDISALKNEIIKYISGMFASGAMTETQTVQMAGLMRVINDIDRIGKRCLEIADDAQNISEQNYHLSENALEEINTVFNIIENMLAKTIASLQNGNNRLAQELLGTYNVREVERTLNSNHIKRLLDGECKPEYTNMYTSLLHSITQISNNCTSIAEVVVSGVHLSILSDEEAENSVILYKKLWKPSA